MWQLTNSTTVTIDPSVTGILNVTRSEPGPIAAPMPNGSHVCCNVCFIDSLETRRSLPDVCFDCVGFHPMVAQHYGDDEGEPLVPGTVAVDSSGTVYLSNCRSVAADGLAARLGTDRAQFLFAFPLQTVGPFGTTTTGAYAR